MALEELNRLNTLAFTHRVFDVARIGALHIEPEKLSSRLTPVKEKFDIEELMMLSTCNRVEFSFLHHGPTTPDFNKALLQELYTEIDAAELREFAEKLEHYHGNKAVEHAMSVASSVDSMIIGEREIITQTRQAYERCAAAGLTGDVLRILNRHVIQTAKKVYTETSISTKPVSVVSLAYHHLKRLQIPLDARFLIIGAGATNTTMGRFLKKHGFRNFAVFNRTFSKAELLASELGGKAHELSALANYTQGFDVIISCTGAEHHVITPALYRHLLQGDSQRKTVIDIAIPQDLDPSIVDQYPVKHISVSYLQRISNENLQERSKELAHVAEILREAQQEFEEIFQIRQVELAMRSVPEQIKRIKSDALNEVFKADVDALDPQSREVLDKVLGYMEKKYIAGPMKLAKEIMVKHG
jgi:glutamyl-tRNA reductase